MNQTGTGMDETAGPRYWAFISYSHRDEAWAAWLQRAIERFRVPRALVGRATDLGPLPRRLFPVFRDREELPAAGSLSDTIARALAQSRSMIVLCSPHSASSRYVEEEVRTFSAHGRGDRIFCLVVDGEPGASLRSDAGEPEAFPRTLLYEVGADGSATRRRAEPLAADVRPGKDSRDNARLKLVAGILGIGFDELKRRERRRRFWQRVQVTALGFVVLGAGFGIWQYQAARVAEEEARAVRERTFAEARQTARASLEIPESDAAARLETALRAARLTRVQYGVVLPEAEVALFRALTTSHLRAYYPDPNSGTDEEGGWYWPAHLDASSTRLLALGTGPTTILNLTGGAHTRLRDPEIAYSNDFSGVFVDGGKRAVTGGADGRVRFWTADGTLDRRLRLHAANVLSVDVAPSGALLTVGCDESTDHLCRDRSARLWSDAGELMVRLVADTAPVTSAVFTAGGTHVVVADEGGTLRVFDRSGTLLASIADAGVWVSPATVSADGSRIVADLCDPFEHSGMFSPLPESLCPAAYDDGGSVIGLFDGAGRRIATLPGRLAAISSGGGLVATGLGNCAEGGSCEGRVNLFDGDGRRIGSFTTGEQLVDIGVDPGGGFAFALTKGGTIAVHDRHGRPVARTGGFLRFPVSAAFSGDGGQLVSLSCATAHQGACLTHDFHVWDPNGALVTYHPTVSAPGSSGFDGRRPALSKGPGGLVAVTPPAGAPVGLWNAQALTFSTLEPLADDPELVAVAPDGTRALAIVRTGPYDADRSLRFLGLPAGRVSAALPSDLEPAGEQAVAALGESIAVGRADGRVAILDWVGTVLAESAVLDGTISSLAAAPRGERLAVLGTDGRGVVLDTALAVLASFDAGPLNPPPGGKWTDFRRTAEYRAAFAPDGRLVVLGPGNLSLWDGGDAPVWNVPLDPDAYDLAVAGRAALLTRCEDRGRGATIGQQLDCYDDRALVVALADGSLVVLEPQTPEDDRVTAAALNPSGTRILTIDQDGTGRLWNGEGHLLDRLPLPVRAAVFDPAGEGLLTLGEENFLQLWETWDDIDAMTREAERRVTILQNSMPEAN